MSPTSYQTAPPRTSIIINGYDIVKLPSFSSVIFQAGSQALGSL